MWFGKTCFAREMEMTTNEFLLCQNIPAQPACQAEVKTAVGRCEDEQAAPWWVYRRPGFDGRERSMDTLSIHILTSVIKRIC